MMKKTNGYQLVVSDGFHDTTHMTSFKLLCQFLVSSIQKQRLR